MWDGFNTQLWEENPKIMNTETRIKKIKWKNVEIKIKALIIISVVLKTWKKMRWE